MNLSFHIWIFFLAVLAFYVSGSESFTQLNYQELSDPSELVDYETHFQEADGRMQGGEVGEPGPPGKKGKPGPSGSAGEKGPPGSPGEKGPQGNQGAPGKAGPAGEAGPPGKLGKKGPSGDKGPVGQSGPAGEKGPRGNKGEKGPQGNKGPAGYKGPVGDPGLNGKPGNNGAAGERGPTGVKGPRGDKGVPGNQGPQGKQGQKGPIGNKGIPGPAGKAGKSGEPGPSGPKGSKGDNGDRGTDGAKGASGAPGPAGPPGPPGKPAAGGQGGGVTYVRWGLNGCPMTAGTNLIYQGRVTASDALLTGGGANLLCMPNKPQFKISKKPTCFTQISGVEYEEPVFNKKLDGGDIPCAVCLTTKRSVKLMIPAKSECPGSAWIREYSGYLMTTLEDLKSNTVYECVDENSKAIPQSETCAGNSGLYHVIFKVGGKGGLPAPYAAKPVVCVVCTL